MGKKSLYYSPRTIERAEKASQLPQENHETHRRFFNAKGFHARQRLHPAFAHSAAKPRTSRATSPTAPLHDPDQSASHLGDESHCLAYLLLLFE